MGVVSGLVMAYQFGTNWSYFSNFAGGVTGPLLAYEVLTAFFLEAGFLGVALFGWNKVGPELHFFATLMVALGTLVSATWILASNSWMQTPAGFEVQGGRVVPVDWLAVIFNPSFPYRLVHMTIAAYLATALFVGAAGAWHLLRGNDTARVRTMLSMAMWMAVIVAPIQIEAGDQHGLNTLKYQPAKIAAIEGHWRSKPGRGRAADPVRLARHGERDDQICGRSSPSRQRHPHPHMGRTISRPRRFSRRRPARFDGGVLDLPHHGRPRLPDAGAWSLEPLAAHPRRSLRFALFLRFALLMGPSGLIAIIAGWVTTEMGRQPWVVYGVMRTSDAVSNHSALALTLSLAVFVVMYFIVFGTGVFYILKLVAVGPQDLGPEQPRPSIDLSGDAPLNARPSRPLSAAPDAAP